MATIEGKIIASPTDEVTVIAPIDAPKMYDGDNTIICGACRTVIWSQSALVKINNIVIKCPKCNKINIVDL